MRLLFKLHLFLVESDKKKMWPREDKYARLCSWWVYVRGVITKLWAADQVTATSQLALIHYSKCLWHLREAVYSAVWGRMWLMWRHITILLIYTYLKPLFNFIPARKSMLLLNHLLYNSLSHVYGFPTSCISPPSPLLHFTFSIFGHCYECLLLVKYWLLTQVFMSQHRFYPKIYLGFSHCCLQARAS